MPNGHRIRERLEDLTVLRDRRLFQSSIKDRPSDLTPLYETLFYDLVQPETLKEFRTWVREEYPQGPSRDWIQSSQWLSWLILEAKTYPALVRIHKEAHEVTETGTLQENIYRFIEKPSRELAKVIVHKCDKINPMRLQWLASWHIAIRDLGWNPQSWVSDWQGWNLEFWQHLRHRIISSLKARWDSCHSLPSTRPFLPSWVDAWPNIGDDPGFNALVSDTPHQKVQALWKEILGLPWDFNAEPCWNTSDSARKILRLRAYFDGEYYQILYPSLARPWGFLWAMKAWGQALPGLYTPQTYNWSRLYGGDPSIRFGWGLWFLRWAFRSSFWEAIGLPDYSSYSQSRMVAWDTLQGLWLALTSIWPLQAASTLDVPYATRQQEWRTEVHDILGVDVESELLIPWGVNRGLPFILFRAWVFSEIVHLYLETSYGPRWWSKRQARFLLTDMWATGTDYSVEDWYKDLGFMDWPPSP